MNGCASSSFSVVNAEDNSMGGVVEGGIGITDDASPRKVVIQKVQAELRQKCRARDETKRELEFLEKGGNLLDYRLQHGASASVQSTSVTDAQKDRLVANDAKGSSAFVTSSHGDSVETSGGPGVVPSEANSADNLMYFDAEAEFSEGGRSLSHHCRSDKKILDKQKHGGAAAFTLPSKAYRRRCRSRPSHEGARSGSVDVDPAHGAVGNSLSRRRGSRDVSDLVSEEEKPEMKLAALANSITPAEGSLVKTETSDERLLNDLDGSKSIELMKKPVEGVSRPTQPDYDDSINPVHERLNEELQTSSAISPQGMGSDGRDRFQLMEKKNPLVIDSQLPLTSTDADDQMAVHNTNGFQRKKEDGESTDALRSNESQVVGVLEPDLVYIHTGVTNVGSTNEMISDVQHVDSLENNRSRILPDEASVMDINKSVTLKKDHEDGDSSSPFKQETAHGSQSLPENGLMLQPMEGFAESISNSNKLLSQVTVEKMDTCSSALSDPIRKHGELLVEYPNPHNETSCSISHEDSVDAKYSNPKQSGLTNKVSTVLDEVKASVTKSKFSGNVDEDSVLREAQIIEVRRKRFAELSVVALPQKIQRRSHWDFVLEEMAWLSNDFAQERMWKIAAAAQVSFKVAIACRLRREARSSGMNAKLIARTLAKAVLEFWDSVVVQGTNEITGQKNLRNEPVRAYAVRLKSHKPSTLFSQADLPLERDRASDWELPDIPEDNTAYEQNFYTVPPAATETYRTSIISHVAHIERSGSYMQEEAELSTCDGVIDFESQDILYDENEGETRGFDFPAGFDNSISSRYGRKKLKQFRHGHGLGSYDVGSDLPLQRSEIKLVNREPGSLAKRPGSGLNGSFTKRVRTASRRVISPFGAGPSGSFQLLNKADASSGDTSSLQDDLSTLRAGLYPSILDTDSARDFEKQSPYESAEVSMMPKKKKAKHMNDDYDQRWQADSSFHEEQRDRLKRRSDTHLLQSNGNSGLFGQPTIRKPKVMRQSSDHSFDNPSQPGMSFPSPVSSQFSNMHNPNKFVKMLAGRDHSRKVKTSKMHTGQPGSGSSWSVFEDQALVVLVHDHGPNWELISDAFSSALHFKCIFRTAKECKERHYNLMDRNSCDGADSAEDSGPSQPYPSALPGIPKGSARQLFQRLLGPVEEDTLKSHFEKIIMIGQKLLIRRSQDPKQLQQPHSSHSAALSQICPNNLNGGPILTPLDLCDAQSPDVFSNGLQVVHNAQNQGVNNPLLPASGACSPLQGFPNMTTGTNFSSSPGTVNSPARDGRHVIPRSGPLSSDDQKKIQHYNQMMPGRNVSQATIPALGTPAGIASGVRINATGSAMGVVSTGNRSFPMARPGLQGTPAPLVATGHGSPASRSHDALQLMRPGMSQDPLRQIMMPDHHMTGGNQGVSHLGGLTSPLPTQAPSTLPAYAINHQAALPVSPQRHQAHHAYFEGTANHSPTTLQQPFGPRLAKERQLPSQRMMLQQQQPQQQQFAASNTLMRHVHSKPQLPLPSPTQHGPQIQPQKSSPGTISALPSSSPMNNSVPQHQPKRQGAVQNPQGGGSLLANNSGKQQSRHHLSQSNRQHPQRQQLQAAQQKVAKGSLSNGVIAGPGTQPLEKREASAPFTQSQGLYATGSAPTNMQPAGPSLVNPSPSHSFPQQKLYPGQGTSAAKHIQNAKPDNVSQSQAVPPASAGHQAGTLVVPGSSLPGTSDGGLNSQNNRGSSSSSNLHDSVPQDGQGLGPRPPAINHDVDEQRQQQQQQQQLQVHKSQPQMQHPSSQSGQAPQQSQILQAGNGNLYGRPSDPRVE